MAAVFFAIDCMVITVTVVRGLMHTCVERNDLIVKG